MRRLLPDFRADLAAIAAVAATVAVSLVAWRAAGAATSRLGRGAEPPEADASAGPEAVAEVDSAELDAGATADAAAAPRTFNVLLITVDTLRADIGFAGYPRPVSPNIDALAARSVVYEHAYALASFTPKCLGPMLIGLYSSETHRDYAHYTNFYPANVFLAERVQEAGGRTVGAASHRYFGWKKGFDQGFDVWDTSSIPANSVDNDPTITSGALTDAFIALLSSARAADIPTKGGAPAPAPERDGPAKGHFFAWVHYLDPHLPYVKQADAPRFEPDPDIPSARAPYDGEVWYTDQQIGRLLRHVAEQPWASETAILLTADHGEAFGEHGHRGHGRELWEALVHVPFVMYVPGAAPRRVAAKRSHIDVVPTVLDLMGIAPDEQLHGASLLADLGAAAPEERDVYIDMPDGPFNDARYAIVTGPSPGTKLIDFGNGRYELYDLAEDPHETKSLTRTDADRLSAAKEALARARASLRERAVPK